MLVYANTNAREALKGSPQLDGNATLQLATRLFPKDKLKPIWEGDLSYTCPPGDEVHVGCFRAFLFWRQRSLQLTIRPSCQRHLLPPVAAEQYICTRCIVLLTGLRAPNGSAVGLFDLSACPQTAAF